MPNMTLDQLIQATEHSLRMDREIINGIRDDAKSQNRSLNDEEKNAVIMLEPKIEAGKANLERLRAEKSKDDADNAAMQVTRPTGAGVSRSGGEFQAGPDSRTVYGAGGSYAATEGPEWVHRNDVNAGRSAAVSRGQSFSDHWAAREYREANAEREKHVTGTHGSLGQMIRSISTSSASAIVPTEWSFPIIDKARNNAVAFQAGATLVPMPAKTVQLGRLTADPTASYRTEGSTVTASDPSFDFIQLVATTLSALTVVSLEFLQDAPDSDSVVENAIAKAMALQLDQVIFYGQLAAGSEPQATTLASPNPRGILQNLVTNASGQILGAGANGTTQTAATPWNEVLATYYQVKRNNEQPGAFVSNDRLVQQYNQMYDSTFQPLRKPPVIENVPWYTTNMIASFTQGTMTSRATDLFCGDFSKVLVGQRLDFTLRILQERYAELGQVGILSHWRGDVQLARPNALSCFRYLQGAA